MTDNAKIEYGSKERWNEDEAWSIVLIGITGAGKSYFANTLLGSTQPNRPDTKEQFDPNSPSASKSTCFYARKSVASVTSKGKSKTKSSENKTDFKFFSYNYLYFNYFQIIF